MSRTQVLIKIKNKKTKKLDKLTLHSFFSSHTKFPNCKCILETVFLYSKFLVSNCHDYLLFLKYCTFPPCCHFLTSQATGNRTQNVDHFTACWDKIHTQLCLVPILKPYLLVTSIPQLRRTVLKFYEG